MLESEVITKKCTLCLEFKSLDNFWAHPGGRFGVRSRCKPCTNVETAKYYKKHRDRIKTYSRSVYRRRLNNVERNKKFNARTNSIFQDFIRPYKDKPCLDCNKAYPSYVMQFDHRDPSTKQYEISRLRGRKNWRELVLQEIAKCDLVCANCHAIRTHNRHYNIQ